MTTRARGPIAHLLSELSHASEIVTTERDFCEPVATSELFAHLCDVNHENNGTDSTTDSTKDNAREKLSRFASSQLNRFIGSVFEYLRKRRVYFLGSDLVLHRDSEEQASLSECKLFPRMLSITCLAAIIFTTLSRRLVWYHSNSKGAALLIAAQAGCITLFGHIAAGAAEAHTLRHFSSAWRRFDTATAAATHHLRRAAIASRHAPLSTPSNLITPPAPSGSSALHNALSKALATGQRAVITTAQVLPGCGLGAFARAAAPAHAAKREGVAMAATPSPPPTQAASDARAAGAPRIWDEERRSGGTGGGVGVGGTRARAARVRARR